jgi:hypothetical protein
VGWIAGAAEPQPRRLKAPLAGFADEEVPEDADALRILEGGGIDEIGLVGGELDAGQDALELMLVLGDVVGEHRDADAGATGLHHAVDGVDLELGAARRALGTAEALEVVDVAEVGGDRLAEADDAVVVEVLDRLGP